MDEKKLMGMITSGYSWEQILNQIIAWEGLDPWDLDLKKLSEAFMGYLKKLDELDFAIPAKYIIIAAVLLRMKSDHLHFLDILDGQEMPDVQDFDPLDLEVEGNGNGQKFEINPVTAPPKRFARRRVMVDDLVLALRRAMKTQEKRIVRHKRLAERIIINQEDVSRRITGLYQRINALLKGMKEEEVKFSKLVPKWERGHIVQTFMPLMHLDCDKKVECRQEEMFDEIFVKRK
jgi:segregation and condensation protein A